MSAAAAFFEELRDSADAAEAAAGTPIDRWFRIGGLPLRLCFIGTALLPVIVPALAHLAIEPGDEPPALTLRCWDCATLGQPFPAAPVGKDSFTPRAEVKGLTDQAFHVAFEPAGRLLSVMDRAGREAFYCVGDASLIPRFDTAEPIRILISWFLRANGRQYLHAGAVGNADGGVLLLGRSGAGKSNTALTCLNDGMGYASDDFCAVASEPDGVVAYSLYCTAKTHARDYERHPYLRTMAPDLDPTGRDKIIYNLNAAASDRLVERFPVRAALLVRQGGEACSLAPLPPSAALAASAPDTAKLIADSGAEVLRVLGAVFRRVPCYTLRLGPDPRRIAPTIAGLLARGGVAE